MGIDHFCSVMFYVRVCDRPKFVRHLPVMIMQTPVPCNPPDKPKRTSIPQLPPAAAGG